jgi:hypothetical protein
MDKLSQKWIATFTSIGDCMAAFYVKNPEGFKKYLLTSHGGLNIMMECYQQMVRTKQIERIELLDEEEKTALKEDTRHFLAGDNFGFTGDKVRVAKALHVIKSTLKKAL